MCLLSLLLLVGVAPSASAALTATLTVAPGFDPAAVQRIAVVVADCGEAVNCPSVEDRAHLEITGLGLEVRPLPPVLVRAALMERGATAYGPELREELAKALELDAILEIDVPFAAKGAFGLRGSQVKAEVRLVAPDGAILFHGVGTARARNNVTAPERGAANIAAELFSRAFR